MLQRFDTSSCLIGIERADLLQVGGGLHGRRVDDQHAVLPLVRREVGQCETGCWAKVYLTRCVPKESVSADACPRSVQQHRAARPRLGLAHQ